MADNLTEIRIQINVTAQKLREADLEPPMAGGYRKLLTVSTKDRRASVSCEIGSDTYSGKRQKCSVFGNYNTRKAELRYANGFISETSIS